MHTTSVTVRGVEHDVRYRDWGYDPDTNGHEIDWEFVHPDAPTDLTDVENETIWLAIAELEPPIFDDDVI